MRGVVLALLFLTAGCGAPAKETAHQETREPVWRLEGLADP